MIDQTKVFSETPKEDYQCQNTYLLHASWQNFSPAFAQVCISLGNELLLVLQPLEDSH